jgi:hypothetical protein
LGFIYHIRGYLRNERRRPRLRSWPVPNSSADFVPIIAAAQSGTGGT